MSREIKFRAWIKAKKEMQMIDFLDFRYKKIGLNNEEYLKEFSNCELMQFTGLRDCKGREIYEGDIIEFALSLIKTIKGSIEFDYGAFYLKTDDKEYNNVLLANMNFDLVEVIGNIFENSELLKWKDG